MANQDHELAITVVREICGLLRKVVPWLAICFLGWCAVLIFREFAGRLTVAQVDVLVRFFAKADSPAYPWGLTIIAMVYGYLQRRERRRKTQNLQDRIVLLERQIDPNRTSSQLERDGSTREEDRL